MNNPFEGFLSSVAQMIKNEKRAEFEAEMARKKAEFERLHGNKCWWDEYYNKNKAKFKTDMKF